MAAQCNAHPPPCSIYPCIIRHDVVLRQLCSTPCACLAFSASIARGNVGRTCRCNSAAAALRPSATSPANARPHGQPRDEECYVISSLLREKSRQGVASHDLMLRMLLHNQRLKRASPGLCQTRHLPVHPKKNPAEAGFFFKQTQQQPGINRYPGSSAAVPNGSGDAACAAPWPLSGGCARG